MLPRNHPDRVRIAFDDHRLVAHAGLLLPATLAHRLGLPELADSHLDLGDAPGRANTGDKLMTLVASALVGGDCIDDADALRAGSSGRVLGCVVKAPSTLGTFLRSFRWGHVRQLDRVSLELLARAWATGAGPGDGPLTIDLDSTICETYGLAKEGARRHGYSGQRGYHPLLAIAAGTGDVLMSRLREGRANTASRRRSLPPGNCGTGALRRGHGATHGAGRQRLLYSLRRRCLPQDEGALLHYHSPAPKPAASGGGDTRGGLDAHPLLDGRCRRRGRNQLHSLRGASPAPRRCGSSSRRVRPTPGSQLALFANYSYHGFITDREGDTLELEG